MLNCIEATQLLSQKQDRPLKAGEKLHLAVHTALCPPCRNFGKQVQIISLKAKQFCALSDNEIAESSNQTK